VTASDGQSARDSRVRWDLLTVAVVSALVLAYLAAAWLEENAACAQETAAAPPDSASQAPDGRSQGAAADWVRDRKPVPDGVLYPYANDPEAQAPPPPREAKPRSWHNRLLFPTVNCPYCGRRVPTQKGSYFFLILGFAGQLLFSARFLVQWIATEKAKKPVVPVSFWWLSIFGSLLLLV
jgi:endogenous inhibitor of DNA gyrase (YacG/DUF329 family)